MQGSAKQGLWAYYRGIFYSMPFDEHNQNLDHVSWFDEIGLPHYGPGFDRIVRGRLIWHQNYQQYVLSWYSLPMLPNRIYRAVVKAFGAHQHPIVEKPIVTEWVR